ncbi:MAG TPA: hypothetical protein VGM88_28635 [Kofleriaceae bacterium]|jgi:hypothetical protein
MGGGMQQGMPGMQHQQQMMQPPMQRPKQGTSKAVPVVVSAGLAIGTFCGLLFGLGTGKAQAGPEPVKMTSNGVEQKPDFVPESMARDPGKAVIPQKGSAATTGSGGSGSDGSGSAVAAVAGTGSDGSGSAGSAAPPVTANTPPRLIVEITPDDAAKIATITVDTKAITGTTLDVPFDAGMDKKKVHVEVKAAGYKDAAQDVEMEKADNTVKFELAKAAPVHTPTTPTAASTFHPGGTTTHPASSTTGPVHTTTHTHSTPTTGKKKPSGGAVDI